MRPSFSLLVFAAGCSLAWASSSPVLEVTNQLIASPAQIGSVASQLATGADGSVFMSWIESAAQGKEKAFRVAEFASAKNEWRTAITVASGANLMVNYWSTPQLAINAQGAVAAVWYIQNEGTDADRYPTYYAMVSRSDDHGKTWSAPARLSTESTTNEFLSLTALANGRFLAVWLDAREKTGHDHGANQTLRARILFSDAPDALLDSRVCDCCATSVVAFADGSALAIYRDRREDEIRDISSVRFQNGQWLEPRRLSQDHWKIAGCPVNGPVISAANARTAAAWYTAANDKPRVYVSASANAGEVFQTPSQVDDGKPLGYVDVVQLANGTRFVSWDEAGSTPSEAVIWLRRILGDGSLSVPARLATIARERMSGVPRLTLVKDAENTSPTQLLLAYTQVEGGQPHVTTRLLRIAPPQLERAPCATCPPEEERGSAVHGYIQSVDTAAGLAKVKHDDIPGVMPAMTMRFHVAPEELAGLKAGAEIFGRIERRDEGWWLFSVRVVERR